MATVPNYPTVSFTEQDSPATPDASLGSIPAYVGRFQQGPIGVPTLVTEELTLIDIFGKPVISSTGNFNNLKDWFSISNYFSYSRGAYVTRIETTGSRNSAKSFGATASDNANIYVPDGREYDTVGSTTSAELTIFSKNPGTWGNDLSVAFYVATANDTLANAGGPSSDWSTHVTNFSDFAQFAEYPLDGEIAILVYSGTSIVDKFILSLTVNSKDVSGKNNYIGDFLKLGSKYVSAYISGTLGTLTTQGTAVALASGLIEDVAIDSSTNVNLITDGFGLYSNPDEISIDYLVDGGYNFEVAHNTIAGICGERKDCFGILGANVADIQNLTKETATSNVIAYRQRLSITGDDETYVGFYGQIKKLYNKFEDKYFWISVGSDLAGLMSIVDSELFPWYAVAGRNRGVLRNVTALGFNPSNTQIGQMYQKNINTVVFDKSVGNVVNGNRTLRPQASAFRDINVRRLFTYVENQTLDDLKYFLMELNTPSNRNRVNSTLTNFLATVKANRGVIDFNVVADETNNSPADIENNLLYVDIQMKPNRVIENITVRFTATDQGISFEEL